MNAVPDSSEVVAFGPFELDRAARELRRQGRRVRIQEQPFQVLALLLDRSGAVVTREDFRRQLWPASVYVDFDHGLNNAIARLREHLGDSAASPRFIETLPRVGYRFICPIRTPVTSGDVAETTETEAAPVVRAGFPTRRWRYALGLGVATTVAITLLAIGLNWYASTDEPRASAGEHPSIAVLPFVSMSSDPEDEHFADGLSEELLNHLTHIPGLSVAGRTSSFYFKGKQESPSIIAETLHVQHLLEGSVRRSGDRVRVTAQLIDARSGYHLWSQTFDRNFAEIFEIQDDIALSVAAQLQVRLSPARDRYLRRYGTRDSEAYRLYLIGMAQRKGQSVRQNLESARRSFEQAIAIDPEFAPAYAGLASYHYHLAAVSLAATEESAHLGGAAAKHALELDPDGSAALRAAADFETWKFRFLGDYAAYDRSGELFRRAMAVDASSAEVHFSYARALQWTEPKRAQALFERASELDQLFRFAQVMAALALQRQGMHEAARRRLVQQVAPSTDWRWAAALGSFEAYQGQLAEAVVLLRTSRFVEQQIELWGAYLSLGDRKAAMDLLRTFEGDALAAALARAAELLMDADHRGAWEHLDRQRRSFAVSRVLDVPTARLALIAAEHEHARAILEQRLPDLVTGDRPIKATQLLPALDLVLAWSATGRADASHRLLDRIFTFLDGPDAPRLPMFTVQRARAHALAGETEPARQALERAYLEGFRMTCALDLHPQPLLYIDCLDTDPAFASLRRDGWFDAWLAGIRADNDRQLGELNDRLASR